MLLDALAQVAGGARASGLSIDDAPSSRVLEVAAATTASARFALLSTSERAAALEALEAAATSRACSDERSAALSSEEAFDGAASASHDECIIAALYSVAAGLLAAVPRLARLGFPASELGVRCLVASARRAGSQRAAASDAAHSPLGGERAADSAIGNARAAWREPRGVRRRVAGTAWREPRGRFAAPQRK